MLEKVEIHSSQDIPSARLRRHLAMCMLAAFVMKIAQSFDAVTTDNNVACRVAGETDDEQNCGITQELPKISLHSYSVKELCTTRGYSFSAFLLQNFFLATFSFMTVICIDTTASILTLRPRSVQRS